MNEIEQIRKLLSRPCKAVVIPHVSPDGDALGACLGWAKYLRIKGHTATVIAPNEFPTFYNWLPGTEDMIFYSSQPNEVLSSLVGVDVIFFLDYNDLKRIGDLKSLVENNPAKFVMIDHHRQPTNFADIMISKPEKSSTSEMIFDIIYSLGDKKLIDKEIGECLYTGILTDTGSFRFSNTTKETHLVTSYLLELGVEPDIVYTKVYNNTIHRLHLLGFTLVERLKQVDDLAASYITLSKEDQDRFNFQQGDTEGFVNWGLSIRGMKLAGFFRESEGYVKVSLRSKGDFDVNILARQHFNGGGHKNAAGGRLEMRLDEAVHLFQSVVHENASKLKFEII